MKAALMAKYRSKGAIESQRHHPNVKETKTWLKGKEDRPIYAVIRDPYTQTLSWYYHVSRGTTYPSLAEFVRSHENGWLLSRLNIYEGVPDIKINYLVFENGIDKALEVLGVDDSSQVPHIGNSVDKKRLYRQNQLLDEEARSVIRQRFPADIELYRKVVAGAAPDFF